MIKQRGFRVAESKSRQHGAVAIIAAFSLVLLIVMYALALDLSHVYITKTGLLAPGVFW